MIDHSAHHCLSPCIHDVGLKSSANDQSITEEHKDEGRLIGRVRERRHRVQKCDANLTSYIFNQSEFSICVQDSCWCSFSLFQIHLNAYSPWKMFSPEHAISSHQLFSSWGHQIWTQILTNRRSLKLDIKKMSLFTHAHFKPPCFFYSVELKLACFHATKVNRKWGCQALKMRKRHNKNKLHSLPCVPYSETTWQLCEQMYYNTSLQYQIIIYNVHYLLHFWFFYILFWCIHKNK